MTDWLTIAKSLPAGRNTRIPCCKADNSMVVYHTARGYSCYCHRCKHSDFESHGVRSIADIRRHKAELEFIHDKEIKLPKDYTLVTPDYAMHWYIKCGISPELAASYGIGYSSILDRIVIPIYEDDKLAALQLRAIHDYQKPKYLNPGGRKIEENVFRSGVSNGVVVVVEDVLSAIKVGKVAPTISILGTNCSDARARKIAKENHTAIVWMDGDKAGREGRANTIKQLSLLGVRCFRVDTTLDPKKYNTEQIKEHLRNMKAC